MARRSRRAPCRLAMKGKYTPGSGAQGEDTHETTSARQVEPPGNFSMLNGTLASVCLNPFASPYDERTASGLGAAFSDLSERSP